MGALMVYEEHSLDPTGILQSKVLLHTAGIVMLTLLVNATTVKKLLKALGLSEVSVAKRISMGTALKRLEEVSLKSINTFNQTDSLLMLTGFLLRKNAACKI